MRRFPRILIGGILGFALGAVTAYAAVTLLSANSHDRSVEAAMSAFFAGGPLGAVVCGILAALRGKAA